MLSGEPIDESAEDISLNELAQTRRQQKLVRYSAAVPETFDFLIVECHRGIYNLWKQVLDRQRRLVDLTATPDKRAFGFFENIVAEYTYEQSVATTG
ncbi:MAG: hypothetical protein R3E34_08115 [Rhodocyclaceae bacterium]